MQGGDFLRCTGACQSWEGGQGGWVAGQRETGSTYSRSHILQVALRAQQTSGGLGAVVAAGYR